MKPKYLEAGERFNHLVTTGEWIPAPVTAKYKHKRHQFKCDCGRLVFLLLSCVKNCESISCGDLHCPYQRQKKHMLTHVKGTRKQTKEFKSWVGIKTRCYNSNHKSYSTCGGMGIIICDEWKDCFKAFIEYIGFAPSKKHRLLRINKDGNFEPGNIEWVAPKKPSRAA